MIEDRGRWGPKALATAELPHEVKQELKRLEGEIPQLRVQLVRGGRANGPPGRRLWLAHSNPDRESVNLRVLARPEDLLKLPLEEILRGSQPPSALGGTPLEEPLLMVCTHGQRDRCCALRGPPVFNALRALAPGLTWRSSHFGGHRFAATALVLPMGLLYGRLQPEEAAPLLASIKERRILALDRLRGRCCWSRPVQAALHRWREETGELSLDAVSVLGETRLEDGIWRVRLAPAGAEEVEYRVRSVILEQPVLKSCGDPEPEPVNLFQAERVAG